jgi:hypothetical protein
MTAYSLERLYRQLPAVYRLRDADHGEALKALVAVIGEQVRVVEDDIAQLYENWFIETCEDWVVPYIGDLLGVRGLHDVHQARFGQRARVANTLGYRRRKGTASMLEQLARDITGWPARAVEFFELLSATQHLNHLRPHNVRTPSLRGAAALEAVGGPFDPAPRTAEVRSIGKERGRYNIPNVGLFLWRLGAYRLTKAVAHHHGGKKYSFNPLGNDTPLFNRPQTEDQITQLAHPVNLPGMLSRRVLYDELEARRLALVNGQPIVPEFFGLRPALRVFLPGDANPVPPEEIAICNLTNWNPPEDKIYKKRDGTSVTRNIRLSVDPALGRLHLKDAVTDDVAVEFQYGFSADMGGGAYERTLRKAGTTQTFAVNKGGALASIAAALTAWGTADKPDAIIQVNDSATYEEQLTVILPAGRTLEIRARNGDRPALRPPSPFAITAAAPGGNEARSSLLLDGLVIADEPLDVQQGDLGVLTLRHCTLVPGLRLSIDATPASPGVPSLKVTGNPNLDVRVERSVVGRLDLGKAEYVRLLDSIVDGTGGKALTATTAVIQSSTLIGAVDVGVMELAENSIFTAAATADRRQQGCVRFCYVLPGPKPRLPRLYRCQPQWASRQAVEAALLIDPNLSSTKQAQIRAEVEARIRPLFTDSVYGRPSYCQLHRLCPPEITRGADDESEMGVFHQLQQPQREANLRASLDEYLRAGLEAGIFFVT